MSAATVSSYMSLASLAILSEDYATALRYAQAAQALLAGMPSVAERGGNRLEWDTRSITQFIADVRRQQSAALAASAGIQQIPVTYARPTETGKYT